MNLPLVLHLHSNPLDVAALREYNPYKKWAVNTFFNYSPINLDADCTEVANVRNKKPNQQSVTKFSKVRGPIETYRSTKMPELIADAKVFHEKVKSPKLSVVHFSADFAEQCRDVDDLLDALSKHSDLGDVAFYKCQAEDLSEISLRQKIEAVPTVILFKSGSNVGRVDGADAAKITAKVREHSGGAADGPLEDRLKALINKGRVVLFMKGDRNTPRCGFSRQMIEILNGTSIPYETFDILTDEEVRQGLKTYSDWPTYPQLYVAGELVGGLDIVKEIVAGGELAQTLNG